MENNTETKTLYPFTMGIRESEGMPQHKINFVLDVSGLGRDDMADWLVNTSSPKVLIAAKYRKLGDAELARLAESSKTTAVVFKLEKCGTRTTVVDYHASLVKILGAEKAEKVIKKFGSAEAAAKAMAEFYDDEE